MAATGLGPAGTQSAPVAYQGNRIFFYLRKHRRSYIAGILTLFAATAAALVPPQILQWAIDDLRAGIAGDTSITRATLAKYAGMAIGIAIVESVLRYVSRLIISGTSRRIEYQLRDDLAAHLLKLDHGFYVKAKTGDLMSRLTNDLQAVRDFIGPTASDISRVTAILAVGLAFMLTIDVRLTLIAFAYLPIVAIVMAYFETNIERKYRRVQEQLSDLTERSQENVSGIRAIKAYAQEEPEIATYGRANEEMRGRAMNLAMFQAGLLPSMIVLTGGGTLLVLWFGGHDVVAGRITLGEFVQFNLILGVLSSQLSYFGWVVATAQLGMVASRRINEVLRTEPAIVGGTASLPGERARGDLEFRDVSVSFGDTPVLEHIDLVIPAGTTIALVGATGQGKTTLVNMVPRLLDPDGGAVLLDGIDVRHLSLASLRSQIGFVPQESYLFSESLRENISYGRDDAGDAAYEHALETSQLSTDLRQLQDGLSTVIGERGITLSGGQKQRAAIARALLKDPPVLILDDALSHVDTHTEEQILRRLHEEMRDRTTILIAHRTSTLRAADTIVVIEGGRIVEQGTHAELIARNRVYARIYREQLALERLQAEVEATRVEGEPAEDRPDDTGGAS